MAISRLVAVVAVASFAGCATMRPREGFVDVQKDLADRTPVAVVWDDGSAAPRAATERVNALLAKPLTMDAAAQVAVLSNRDLQATYESLGVAQADLVEAGLLRNPIFDGSVRFREGGSPMPTVDLGIAFEFLDVFFIPLRKRVAEARLAVTKAEVASAVLELVGRTRQAYLDVQAAQQAVELRRQVVQAADASFELARKLRAAGNTRELDVLTERALREESRLALSMAEADLVQKRERLNRLMGIFGPATQWTVAARMPEPAGDDVAGEGLEAKAVERSLDLKQRSAAVDAAFAQLGIARPVGYFQSLEVGAAAERDGGEWEVGPSFALPLPLFSQGQPAVARAQTALRQASHRYYATAVEVRSATRAAWARVRALRQQVDFYRATMLPLRAAVVERSQLQYNAMQLGGFSLLQAKRDQIEAARTYLALLADYWSARSDLELLLNGHLVRASEPSTSVEPTATRATSPAGGH